jgi:hypothetical protein
MKNTKRCTTWTCTPFPYAARTTLCNFASFTNDPSVIVNWVLSLVALKWWLWSSFFCCSILVRRPVYTLPIHRVIHPSDVSSWSIYHFTWIPLTCFSGGCKGYLEWGEFWRVYFIASLGSSNDSFTAFLGVVNWVVLLILWNWSDGFRRRWWVLVQFSEESARTANRFFENNFCWRSHFLGFIVFHIVIYCLNFWSSSLRGMREKRWR